VSVFRFILPGCRHYCCSWLSVGFVGTDVCDFCRAGRKVFLRLGDDCFYSKKEFLAYFIVYNLVRLVMLQAAKRQGVKLKTISFVDALRWLVTANPADPLLALMLVPHRLRRFDPRTKKRRHKPYPYMIKPRPELRKKKLSHILER